MTEQFEPSHVEAVAGILGLHANDNITALVPQVLTVDVVVDHKEEGEGYDEGSTAHFRKCRIHVVLK